MYRTLSSRTLLAHRRLTVVEDQVEMPDGQTGDYIWFAGKRDGVGVIVRGSDGRILIQQEYSYIPGVRLFQLPGGGIEEGETPEAAANRELTEEAGLKAGRLTLLGSYFLDHRRSIGRMFVFLGEELAESQTSQKDKYEIDLSMEWLTESEIDELIRAAKIENVHLIAGWTLYNPHRQAGNSELGMPEPESRQEDL